jgi:hypothetical protein
MVKGDSNEMKNGLAEMSKNLMAKKRMKIRRYRISLKKQRRNKTGIDAKIMKIMK